MGREFLPWNDLGSGYWTPATQLRICVGPWVCVDWIWKKWTLHVGSSVLMPPTGPWGQRGPYKVSWGAYWSKVMGPGSREGPKVTLSVLFSSFANQELVLKQLAELKEGHLRTSERSSYPLLTHSALGWVLSCFWGSWSTNWVLSDLRWAP